MLRSIVEVSIVEVSWMPANHIVKQGEHISRIARDYGFHGYKVIWDHPDNQDLKELRGNPNVLLPGDTLVVPDKQEKQDQVATGKTYTYQTNSPQLKLRFVLRDYDNQPMPNVACTLEVEGVASDLTTNGDGLIETEVPASAESGKLVIPDLELEFAIQIGYLDPVDQDSGASARLINLGYFEGPSGDEAVDQLRFQYAVERFQRDYELEVSAQVDDATKSKLTDVHGS